MASEFDDENFDNIGNFYVTPHNTRTIDAYITGVIGAVQPYQDLIHTIRTANEGDIINMYLNSSGGRLATAVQIVSAMRLTKARIHVHIEGDCISATTFIAMHGDEYTISPFCRFMFHNYSGSMLGKGGEMHSNAVYMHSWIDEFYHDIYKNFLTNEEIKSIIDGVDMWMSSDSFADRMSYKKELEYLERQQSTIEAAEGNVEDAPEPILVPKPKPKRKQNNEPTHSPE
jgi:ATP-dependent protease ClpP protease subunit